MKDLEQRVREASRRSEKNQVSPTTLFYFMPGQLVTRRHRAFSKLDPRTTGPLRVKSVAGTYRQRVTLDPLVGDGEAPKRRKRLIVHASHLVPYDKPYVEPEDIDVGEDATPEAEDKPED